LPPHSELLGSANFNYFVEAQSGTLDQGQRDDQSPAPKRYCHAMPKILKFAPLCAVSPELKYPFTELWRVIE